MSNRLPGPFREGRTTPEEQHADGHGSDHEELAHGASVGERHEISPTEGHFGQTVSAMCVDTLTGGTGGCHWWAPRVWIQGS